MKRIPKWKRNWLNMVAGLLMICGNVILTFYALENPSLFIPMTMILSSIFIQDKIFEKGVKR